MLFATPQKFYCPKIDRDFFWNDNSIASSTFEDIARPRDVIREYTSVAQQKAVLKEASNSEETLSPAEVTVLASTFYGTLYEDGEVNLLRYFGGTLDLTTTSYFYRYSLYTYCCQVDMRF